MIYIIITTCIHNKVGVKNSIHRENRYIECIESLLNLIKNNNKVYPIIVENNGQRETFLDKFNCDIVYTNNNKFNFKNKEGNELLDIKDVINKYKIKDNDTIIKLTGRYKILNLDFINLVINNCNKMEAFIKFFNVCTLRYHPKHDDCVLGLFAIKCKYLKILNIIIRKAQSASFQTMFQKMLIKILIIKNLNLECCFADNLRKLIV